MYLTEYWNDDDDEDEILVLPHLHEQLSSMLEFEKDNPEQETPNQVQ